MVDAAGRSTVGVADIPRTFFTPRRVFERVEDVAAWGWPLAILLTAFAVTGYATVQTGLITREVDRQVQASIAEIDRTQRDVVERSALRRMYEQEIKKGEFVKLLTQIRVVVAEPAKALVTALLIAAILYGVVALTGRKPEWHTLLTICVFAGFVDFLRLLTQLGLMLCYGTLEVYTSLTPLASFLAQSEGADATAVAAVAGLLSAVDPFRIWYWLVVIIGLSVTTQLRGWRAWLVCTLCWLIAAGVRCGIAVAAVANATRGAEGS
jgi:hypothetical protein